MNAVPSTRKSQSQLEARADRDGSFHDSGRNAGVGQGLNHRGVGSFHERPQARVEVSPWIGSWDGKLTLASRVVPTSLALVALTLIVIAGQVRRLDYEREWS